MLAKELRYSLILHVYCIYTDDTLFSFQRELIKEVVLHELGLKAEDVSQLLMDSNSVRVEHYVHLRLELRRSVSSKSIDKNIIGNSCSIHTYMAYL